MNKNAICYFFLLVIVVVLSNYALAEQNGNGFIMRNNVQFGMTPSEVEKLETFSLIEHRPEWNQYYFGFGEVAGIKDSEVMYVFDDLDGLKSLEIFFAINNQYKTDISTKADYKTTSSSLRQKYGQPLGNTNGESYYLRGSSLDFFIQSYQVYKMLGNESNYEEWVVPQEDGIVKIDHYFLSNGVNVLSHYLQYTFFSNNEMNNQLQDL